MIWHSESTAAVISQLQTDRAEGLTTAEATVRRNTAPDNRVLPLGQQPFFVRFWNRLKNPAVWLLIAASLVALALSLNRRFSGYADEVWWPFAVVPMLVLLRCLLSVLGDNRAAKALGFLSRSVTTPVRVWRDGAEQRVAADELVPGDVLALSAGDWIPADCRLLESTRLRCDESPLTGDPLPAEKDAEAPVAAIAPLKERVNMLYAGGTVLHGQARAVVVETGARTEAGKATALQSAGAQAMLPQQTALSRAARALTLPVLVIAAAVFAAAVIGGASILPALLWALTFAVLALPQELTSFASLAFAPVVRRMARRGVVVRHAAAAETLSRVSVIGADKSTFTQSSMTLVRAFVGDHMVKLDDNRMPEDVNTLVQLAALCSNSRTKRTAEGMVVTGDPTDAAIVTYALNHGMDRTELAAAYPRLGEIPLDTTRRRMTAVHLIEGRHVVIVKGAPEGLLPLCGTLPEAMQDAEEFMEAGALQVLAVAYKYIDEMPTHCFADELEQGLTFLGLLGFSDPPCPEAVAAVADCRAAGVRPVMLTGESLPTATAVAKRLRMLESANEAVAANALPALPREEAAQVCVCARAAAEDKVRIVEAWQRQGGVVALTGDRAAEVPALRAADIGCAVQNDHAAAAIATADAVLTDGRFSTLVGAVKESRALALNLRHMMQYWIARHVGEALLLAAALLVWGGVPTSLVALLWLCLVTGVLPLWALGAEPAGRGTMRRPPRTAGEGPVANGAGWIAAFGGLLLGALAIGALALGDTVATGWSMAFAVLSFGELSLLLCARSAEPLFRSRPLHAPATWAALLAGVALLLPLWLVPALQTLCGLTALSAAQWRLVALLSVVPFVLCEAIKLVRSLFSRQQPV